MVEILISQEHRTALINGLVMDHDLSQEKAEEIIAMLASWLNHHLPMAYLQLEQASHDAGIAAKLAGECYSEGYKFGREEAIAKAKVLGDDYDRELKSARKGMEAYRKGLDGWLKIKNSLEMQLATSRTMINSLQTQIQRMNCTIANFKERDDVYAEMAELAGPLLAFADNYRRMTERKSAAEEKPAIEGEVADGV